MLHLPDRPGRLWKTCRALFLLLGLAAIPGGGPAAQGAPERVMIRPGVDVASGSSSTTRFFQVGGLDVVGLFVGQPNALTRNDRALLRFDLAPYAVRTRGAAPVRRATLTFQINAFRSRQTTRTLEIGHLRGDLLEFSEFDLVRDDCDRLGAVSVTKSGVEYSLDVTEAVNADLRQGNLFAAFRLRDVDGEKQGNLHGEPEGEGITREGAKRPRLEIEFKPESVIAAGVRPETEGTRP